MTGQLLAVVEVDQAERVSCQAVGCGRGVFRRVHVVRHDDGALGVYGSDCFDRLFGSLIARAPRYGGSSEGRTLTAEERDMLASNAERLIARFDQEHQVQLERMAQAERERQERACAVKNEMRHKLLQLKRAFNEKSPTRSLTPEEFASVADEAKAIVRERFNVDPNLAGWHGLVVAEARKLLGR